jgi:Amidohydrolase
MPNVFAKISGLDTDRADDWTAVDIAPYIDHALELFGPERLMFGSDSRQLKRVCKFASGLTFTIPAGIPRSRAVAEAQCVGCAADYNRAERQRNNRSLAVIVGQLAAHCARVP